MAHDGGGVEGNSLKSVQYEFICDDGPSAEFRVGRFRMVEEINASFEIDVDLVTKDQSANTDGLLGGSCQIDIARGDHMRTVYGVIASVQYIGHTEDQLLVNIKAVPAFELLRQQSHSRIFQDMTVQAILAEVLGGLGHGRGFDPGAVARGTGVRDYCVQYRETDHDFCVRLMEEEGISYHFAHDEGAGKEVLTFTYANSDFSSLQNVDGSSLVPIIRDRRQTADVESLASFEYRKTLTTMGHMWRDFDFMTPLSLIEASGGGSPRIYQHTERRYIYDDSGARNADHLQGAQQGAALGVGRSNVTQVGVGRTFEVDRHDREDLETTFIVTRALHEGWCPEELHSPSDGTDRSQPRYRNSFECAPLASAIRPARKTPRPKVHGAETGIVTGPPGEEIHVDEHGRVKVQFHWEEETTYDDTSSCWIRVRQQWSGPGWGFQFIPRVGQEVLIEFLAGNPDRPVVAGTLYNGDNPYPYPLPDEKTRSGIKTDTVAGEGSNEIRFEDMTGSEEVYVHCQKDFTILTENDKNQHTKHDETLTIDNDRTKEVGHDQRETVHNDKTILVEGYHNETIVKDMRLGVQANRTSSVTLDDNEAIGGAHTQSIGSSCTQSVGDSKSVSVGSSLTESVGANKSITVGGSYSNATGGAVAITAGLAAAVTAGLSASVVAGKSLTLSAAMNVSETAGNNMRIGSGGNMAIQCDKKATITVAEELTISVGDAKIVLNKNGDIDISGVNINIKGTGAITTKGSSIDNN